MKINIQKQFDILQNRIKYSKKIYIYKPSKSRAKYVDLYTYGYPGLILHLLLKLKFKNSFKYRIGKKCIKSLIYNFPCKYRVAKVYKALYWILLIFYGLYLGMRL